MAYYIVFIKIIVHFELKVNENKLLVKIENYIFKIQLTFKYHDKNMQNDIDDSGRLGLNLFKVL